MGRTPRVPGRVPAADPRLLVTLRAVAVAEHAGRARLRSLRGLGKAVGAVSSASGTNDDRDEETTIIRADVRGARTPPTRAGTRVTDSPRTIPLAVYLPHPEGEGSGMVSGLDLRSGGLVAGTLTGATPRYRAGQGPLPGGSTQVETPRYPATTAAGSVAGALGHPTSNPSHSTEPGSTDRIACHWSGMRTRVPPGLGRCSC